MANKKMNDLLAAKLQKKEEERVGEFKNPNVEGKEKVAFNDFREQLGGKVELMLVTKVKKHAKDENDNNIVDENGNSVYEDIYAFIDARYPDYWSFGGSALKRIYNDLVDSETTEEEINKSLAESPLIFKLQKKKLENGKNKGKTMIDWILQA